MKMSEIFLLVGMPIISGLIGWFTNYIAVKMLLKPVKPLKILGLTFQGLLPRRHHELAERISVAIAKDFLTEEDIKGFIRQIKMENFLNGYIKQKWDEKVTEILSGIPMLSMFVGPEQLHGIRDKVAQAFSGNSDEFVGLLSAQLSGNIDLAGTIKKNILNFDLSQLESIIEEIAHKEFREIEILGGVLGFIIGLVQALLVFIFF